MKQSARTGKHTGALIRRARRAAGMTQTELAQRIGVRQATISRLERGEDDTRFSTVLGALSALGLEITIEERGNARAPNLEDLF